ncbi:peptidase inhibitor family I36 protein [Nocardia iowensis]|uniref:Peptidase inhibitor family I36 protein n=1 Tax=Nocardia iowensis TaxID=204891 RepID=A0ABX8S3D3_NOCIO|nr:peptidase inhibitor family I36 protein [Nocardia iowensis]
MKTKVSSIHRFRSALTGTILAIGLYAASSGAPVTAAPATGDGKCERGEICVWQNDDFKGCFYDFVPPNEDSNYGNGSPRWNNCDGTMEDKISSYRNRSGHWVVFGETRANAGRWGAAGQFRHCAAPGAESSNLANFGDPLMWSIENRISSHDTFDWGNNPPDVCIWWDRD